MIVMANDSKTSNKPIQKFVWKGVSASVFENYPDGKDVPYYKTQIVRTYRDGSGFKSASTFGRDELTLVIKVAQDAWDFILDREREVRREKKGQAKA